FQRADATKSRSSFVLDHDRAGRGALHVRLSATCGPLPSASTTAKAAWQEAFAGGCVNVQLRSTNPRTELTASLRDEAARIVGFATRGDLQAKLIQRSDRRLHLDPLP